MAIIIRRIMSKSRLLSLMHNDIDRKDEPPDYPSMKSISADVAAHMFADGKTVKVYRHQAMGGTVVEYDPEEL